MGSGGKHGVSVENTGSKCKTQQNHYFDQQRSLNFVISSNISNTRDSVSSGYPNTEKRVENTTHSGVFLTKFEVLG